MSLTTKQIDELRAYAKDRKGELAKLINDAADTIEVLSAKRLETGSCETCKRASSYCCKTEKDITRCPIEEHYMLPRDGYCHLYEGR